MININFVAVCHTRRLHVTAAIVTIYILPIFYQAIIDVMANRCLTVTAACALGTFFSLLAGAMAYAYHLPERFSPGTFDIWVSSTH